jgi:hypothetical protein
VEADMNTVHAGVTTRSPDRRLTWFVAVATVATVTGLALSAAVPPLPGAEALGSEDIVDAAAGVAAGVLGWALVRRRAAVGLGWAMVALAVTTGAVWLLGGIADLLAADGTPPPVASTLQVIAGTLFIASYGLLVFPVLLLLPDGRLPGRRWRPVAWLAVTAIGLSMLAVLLRPGPVDDDVAGWGDNPLGIDALGKIADATATVGLGMAAVALVAAVVAYAVRLGRSRGLGRRQLLIVLVGVIVMIAGIAADSALPGTLSAVIIFAALFGSIAWAVLGA